MKRAFIIFRILVISLSMHAQNADSDVELGLKYLNQGLFEQAYKCFENTTRYRNVLGQYYMAECIAKGYGVEKDDKRAFSMYRRLAERGLPVAQAKTAYLLFKGVGTLANKEKAIYWLEKATNYPEPDAYTKYVVGLCSEEGLGRQADMNEAINCYSKACENGVDDAYIHLALLYAEGTLVKRDYIKSLSIIKEAITKNNTVFDYACYGQILLEKGDVNMAKKIWKDLIANNSYYTEHGTDYFSSKMRQISPITPKTMDNLYANNSSNSIEHEKRTPNPVKADISTTKNELSGLTNEDTHIVYIEKEKNRNNQINYQIAAETTPISSNQDNVSSDIDSNIPKGNVVCENTLAIIICNENYQDVASVPYAHRDGESFSNYCNRLLGVPKEQIRVVKDATYNNIRREMNWLKEITPKFNGEANIIFYYAGHGIPDESTRDAYLLPVDGSGTDVSTGYSLDQLYKSLGALPVKTVNVFLDACFSGSQRDNGMLASARGVAIKVKDKKPTGNLVVLSAAQGDETAYPYKEQGHGLFTYYLLKKLKETSGNVTLEELNNYIVSQVGKKSLLINGKSQTPTISTSASVGDSWKQWKLK